MTKRTIEFHNTALERIQLVNDELVTGYRCKPYTDKPPEMIAIYRGVRPIRVFWRLVTVDGAHYHCTERVNVRRQGVSISPRDALRGARQWARKLKLQCFAREWEEGPQLYFEIARAALVPLSTYNDVIQDSTPDLRKNPDLAWILNHDD